MSTLAQLRTLLETDPQDAGRWCDYIEALIAAGELEVAKQMLTLGQQHGLAGERTERLQAQLQQPAVTDENKDVLKLQQRLPLAELTNQLVVYLDLGQIDAAMSIATTITKYYPRNALGWKVLGTLLSKQGQHEEGIATLARAAKITPADHEIHGNLGIALRCVKRLEAAINSLQRAIRLNPKHADSYNNLGLAIHDSGEPEKAIEYYRHALKLRPDFVEAHSNLGIALQDLGQLDNAVEAFRRALNINPRFIEAYVNLGSGLIDQEQFDEAIRALITALEIQPRQADAHYNLANALQSNWKYELAIAHYRKALEIKPDFHGAFSNLLFCVNYDPDLSGEQIYAYYREYEDRFARSLYGEWKPYPHNRDPHRRLKIGYVSPSFYNHSCSYFLEPLLSHHDHDQVEVYAYAQLTRSDEVTKRYQSYVDHWIPTRGLSDEALTERIRSDGIDILIDVTGHTGDNRLLVFARKPAPVSLHWLDFGYTTGLTAIDYYLTDEATIPEGAEQYFAEKPWRLPTPAYAYRAAPNMGEVNALPALSKGYITFGTLTRAVRLNHKVIRTWVEILKAVPDSHLIINSGNFKSVEMQERIAEQFVAQGIARARLEIGATSPPWDVLRNIDIGLDCFPHNSGTTLFEHLYMGSPFVTLANRPSVGRLGASILSGAGHGEWIAETEQEYIAKAVALASDLPGLAKLRSELRTQLQHSPLMDEEGFTRAVEQAYRHMWQMWCESIN